MDGIGCAAQGAALAAGRDAIAWPPLEVVRASGSRLYDAHGRSYVDGDAGAGLLVHGHGHPFIEAAVRAPLTSGHRHARRGPGVGPAAVLGERLAGVAPRGLERVLLCSDGTAALEMATAVARRRWRRRHDAARGECSILRARDAEAGDSDNLVALLEAEGERAGAVVVEPLVQLAGGLLVHPPGHLRALREACTACGALLIGIDAATGLGRTGRLFACEHDEVVPDLVCLGDALTAGRRPLGAVLASAELFPEVEAVGGVAAGGGPQAPDPLACVVANATLELFELERTLERLQPRIELLGRWLQELVRPVPAVAGIRRGGFMCGIQLRGYSAASRMGQRVALAALRRGAVLRPLGDVLVLTPALSIAEAELRRLVEITAGAIAEASAQPLPAAA